MAKYYLGVTRAGSNPGENIILLGGKQASPIMANRLKCRIRHGSLLTGVCGG